MLTRWLHEDSTPSSGGSGMGSVAGREGPFGRGLRPEVHARSAIRNEGCGRLRELLTSRPPRSPRTPRRAGAASRDKLRASTVSPAETRIRPGLEEVRITG